MSRFGHKQILNLWSGNNVNLFYRVIPGLQVETFGKPEFFTNYMCSSSYVWSDYLTKKINIKYHHGCSTFLYAHAMIKEKDFKSKNNLVFLPKSDITTKLDRDYSKKIFNYFPEDSYFLSFPSDYLYWVNIIDDKKIDKIIVLYHDPYSSCWTFNLVNLLNTFKNIYFPFFSSAVLYALYSDCSIKFYNCEKIFKQSDINPILESYDISKFTKENVDIQNYLKKVFDENINDEKNYLVKTFLSTEKRQSPKQLLTSIYNLHEYSYNSKYLIEDYYENYILSNNLKEIEEIKIKYDLYEESEWESRIENKCKKYDQSKGSNYLKNLIQKL